MTSVLASILSKPLRRRSITGGISPAPNKSASLRSRIMPMPLPPNLVLPVAQYAGDNAIPLVQAGDEVRKYQPLTRDPATGLSHLHAPTSGTITSVSDAPIGGPPHQSTLSIHLACDGVDTALELRPFANYQDLTAAELRREIAAAGIVGMGGAGFPVARKLALAEEQGTELAIINAAECEPYISTDEALMRERARQVVLGAEILRAASRSARCIIAIEQDKSDAITALREALSHSAVELLLLHNNYPTGSEKQLIQAVTGLEVPTGKYPLDIGIVVHNVGTAYAVYQAVVEGKPCITRVTTLCGNALLTPKNFDILIGTSVEFLLQLCGVDKTRHAMTILGGSLMGLELARTDVPVTKTTNCLIAATLDELPTPEPERACIRCGYCADVCPARLLPQQLYLDARAHRHDQLAQHGLADCIECGACAYVCPSKIPLVQYYLAAKQQIDELAESRQQSREWQSRFQYHQYRIKQDKDKGREASHVRRAATVQRASTTGADKSNAAAPAFSRTQAQQEIADAVARAKARKAAMGRLPSHHSSSATDTEE